MENTKVTFRRINGRIIPIRNGAKAKDKPGITGIHVVAGAAGGYVGSKHGLKVAGVKSRESMKFVMNGMAKDHVVVADFIKESGVKNVESIAGINAAQRHPQVPRGLKSGSFWKRMQTNAAFGPNTKRWNEKAGFVYTPYQMANRSVVAHELGHAREFQLKNNRYVFDRGHLTGGTYRREVAAWNLAPGKVDPLMRHHALQTYKNARNYSRKYALIGAAAALGATWLYGKMRDNGK